MSEYAAVVGSWHITVYETDGPPTRGFCTFGADGTLVTSEHPVVTPPGAPSVIFTSAGHGAWQATGPDAVVFTFAALGSDITGNLFTVVTFRGDARVNQDAMTFTGELTATLDNPQGVEMAVFPLRIEGRRIVAQQPTSASASGDARAARHAAAAVT